MPKDCTDLLIYINIYYTK